MAQAKGRRGVSQPQLPKAATNNIPQGINFTQKGTGGSIAAGKALGGSFTKVSNNPHPVSRGSDTTNPRVAQSKASKGNAPSVTTLAKIAAVRGITKLASGVANNKGAANGSISKGDKGGSMSTTDPRKTGIFGNNLAKKVAPKQRALGSQSGLGGGGTSGGYKLVKR